MENIFTTISDEIIYLEYINVFRVNFSANGIEDFLNKALPKKNKKIYSIFKIKDELLFIICEIIIIISRNIEI